jgi:hypothetical protein
MPLYQYRCKHCKLGLEVLRTFDDYKIPPTLDEEGEAGSAMCLPDAESEAQESPASQQPHDWERHISSGTTILKAPGWGGKGHW